MSKLINEIGHKYGRLTVIERGPNNKNGRAQWLCQCECGNKVLVLGPQLRSGKTKSCGCYQKDRTREASLIDLRGKTINNFTILNYDKNREKWHCRCNLCGNEEVYILTTNLYKQESCGCLTSSKGERKIEEILTQNNIPFIREKRFSDLIFEDTKSPARFDFFVQNKYIIEFDGRQHFIEGNGYYDNEIKFEKTQQHDKIKNNYCHSHQIPIIRIPYYELNNINLQMLQPETSQYLLLQEDIIC